MSNYKRQVTLTQKRKAAIKVKKVKTKTFKTPSQIPVTSIERISQLIHDDRIRMESIRKGL